ncbi:MAG: bifunctional serine/threonine-protein kinase/formylglycine-generating enzyme family protein [Pirellulales bacterium]
MNRPNDISKAAGDAPPCSWFSDNGLANEPNSDSNGRDECPQELSQIGPYQLQEKLGRGGMGVVYKAIHLKLKRTVAIKLLLPELTRNSQAIARFEREIEAVGQLDHPNIVRATDADESDGTHYLVMEYVDGCNLSELVRRTGPLAVSDACELIRQAAIGLQHAHEAGLVHRDVKPGNLMLATDGLVKLLDLGLANLQQSDGDRGLTATGTAMGTVDYMSPEQALNTKNADRRADVYSLGATLWYLLTGREIYAGNSALEKLMAHQGKPIPSLREVRPDVPPALDSLFMRMLAKTPESRIQTMAEVAVALEGCRESEVSTTSKYTAAIAGSRPYICLPEAKPSPGPILATSAAARSCLPLATEEATLASPMSQTEADPETERLSVRPATRPLVTSQSTRPLRWQVLRSPPNWPLAAYAAGAAGAAALLLAGIVLLIPTRHGVMRIEINDPQIEVLVDGQGATIKGAKPQEIQLEPGQHSLRIRYGPLDFETDKFILSQGDAVTLKVELLPGQVQVVQGDTSLGARPLPAIAPFSAQQARACQEAWAKHLGVPVEFTNTVGMKFVLIPPGEFTMGMSRAEAEAMAALSPLNEQWQGVSLSSAPAHRVRLTRAYYLGTYEVTQEQYEKVIGSNPAYFSPTGPGKDSVVKEDSRQHPVETVSYIDAAEFCIKLNKRELLPPVYSNENNVVTLLPGDGYRLPTEAEWEGACRAGTTSPWFHGDQWSSLEAVAWWMRNSKGMTHPVGQLRRNPFGLHDVHGNVSEWCQDAYDAQAYQQRGAGPVEDPQGPETGSARVVRGGNWRDGIASSRSALRVAADVDYRRPHVGFRVMLGIDAMRQAWKAKAPPMPNSQAQ